MLCNKGFGIHQFGTGIVTLARSQSYEKLNVQLMISGNYDGLDIATFAKEIIA
jgi:hypothetical protein